MSQFKGKVAVATGAGRTNEVADFVVYLASDKSSFVTGANFDINGGLAFSKIFI